MYIEPQTNIKILHNVPLDTSYDHTIYFTSAITQHGYFAYMAKYDLSNYSYQRVQRGRARVGIKADDLYDCNYMMFQNTAYGNKWFYAFITSVEFINNETSEITFEIDVMQTWHFDYHPDYCFVEREHSETDNIGDNIIPEPLACGEYVFNDVHPLEVTKDGQPIDFSDMSVIVGIIDVNDITGATHGVRYDGIFGACELYAFSASDASGINGLLSQYLQKPEAVQTIYMCPTALIGQTDPNTHKIVGTEKAKTWPINDTPINSAMSINGYSPVKNNKLFTYPFNFYHVDNNSGSGLSLPYEFFGNLTPSLMISGMITQPVKVILRPRNYKGAMTQTLDFSTVESITMSNFPLCSWGVDSYQAWIAQSSVPFALDVLKNTVSTLSSYASASSQSQAEGAVEGGAQGSINLIFSRMKQAYSASIANDITVGSVNNGGINVADQTNNFYGGRCSITAQYAAMIDDYFSRFGYATNRLKIPNRNIRPHWNYVKTIGCTLVGSIPADDMRKICSIYDRGITFWKNGSEVGNYTLDNSPL